MVPPKPALWMDNSRTDPLRVEKSMVLIEQMGGARGCQEFFHQQQGSCFGLACRGSTAKLVRKNSVLEPFRGGHNSSRTGAIVDHMAE